MYTYIYIYICRAREREREREMDTLINTNPLAADPPQGPLRGILPPAILECPSPTIPMAFWPYNDFFAEYLAKP